MNSNKKISEKEIQVKIRKIDGAMTRRYVINGEIKQKLYDCIIVKSTKNIERKK